MANKTRNTYSTEAIAHGIEIPTAMFNNILPEMITSFEF